jgi:hypothetical protein
MDKLSYKDFAGRIKQKYPQYANIDDMELTQKIIAKHPEYKESVEDYSSMYQPEMSKGESFSRGALQGVSLGFADEIKAKIDQLRGQGNYPENVQRERDLYENAQQSNPKTYLGGTLTGAAPSALLMPESIPARIGVGGLQGAAMAYGEQGKNVSIPKIVQGAGLGLTTAGAGEGLAKLGGKIAGKLTPEALQTSAQEEALKSVAPFKGAIKKFSKNLKSGETTEEDLRNAGKYLLENNMIKPLASREDILQGISQKVNQTGKDIGDLYTTIDELKPEGINKNSILAKIDEYTKNKGQRITESDNAAVDRIKNEIVKIPEQNGNIKYSDLHDKVSRLAGEFSTQNITENAKNTAKNVVGVVNNEMKDVIEKNAGSGYREYLDTLNKAYPVEKTLDTVKAEMIAQNMGNRTAGLTDIIAGTGAGVLGGLAYATHNPLLAAGAGAAFIGKKLSEKYGHQTASYILDKISKTVDNEAIQNFGNLATKTGQIAAPFLKSGMPPAMVHMILKEKNPEYKKAIQEETQKKADEYATNPPPMNQYPISNSQENKNAVQ